MFSIHCVFLSFVFIVENIVELMRENDSYTCLNLSWLTSRCRVLRHSAETWIECKLNRRFGWMILVILWHILKCVKTFFSHLSCTSNCFRHCRYTASTVLALLQEIACSADSKLNWSLLAKNSNSGISNAKEYQSLWRHLAYRTNISESFEDDALPLVNSLFQIRI